MVYICCRLVLVRLKKALKVQLVSDEVISEILNTDI